MDVSLYSGKLPGTNPEIGAGLLSSSNRMRFWKQDMLNKMRLISRYRKKNVQPFLLWVEKEHLADFLAIHTPCST